MRIVEKLILIKLCSLLCYVGFARGQDTFSRPEPSMAGLAKDTIAVYIYGDDLLVLTESYKLSEHVAMIDYIQETIMRRIARAGINVTNFELSHRKIAYPRFYVGISLSDPVNNQTSYGYAFTIIVGLGQQVVLSRNKSIKTFSLTWQRWRTGFASKKNVFLSINKMIEEKTDEFIIEFLKANRDH